MNGKSKYLVNRCLLGTFRNNDTKKWTLIKQALLGSSLPTTPSSCDTVIQKDSSFPEVGPLSKFF